MSPLGDPDLDVPAQTVPLADDGGDPLSGAADRRDIEVTQLTRSLYPEADIMVDPNDGYTMTAMADYLEAVAACGLFWIEEPFQERRSDFGHL